MRAALLGLAASASLAACAVATAKPHGSTAPAPAAGDDACAWVTGYGGEEVCGVRVPGGDAMGCVRTGARPHGVALSPDGSRLYVSNEGAGTVSLVDTATLSVVKTASVGRAPNQLALTPRADRVWVTNNGDGTVSVLDAATLGLVHTLPVGSKPHIVSMTSRGEALVTLEGDGAVGVFDLDTFAELRSIPVFGLPRVLTVSPDGGTAFLTLRWLNGALVLDTEAGQVRGLVSLGESAFAPEGKVAHGLTLSSDGATLLLTSQTAGSLAFLDAGDPSTAAEVHVGNDPNWVGVTPDDRYAVVSNTGDDTVAIVDVARREVVATTPVGPKPKRLVVGRCPAEPARGRR